MEIILAPSILAADFGILERQIKETERAGAKYLHIDVMDGMFVPNISFGMPVVQSLRKYVNTVFDVHLMIVEPERYIDRFIDAGADIVCFHAEATEDIGKCIDMIKARGRRAAVAISPKTPAEAVIPYIDRLDMVLCMTVEPGYGGQSYMPEVEEKVRRIRAAAGDRLDIEVDGGITEETIGRAVSAGANVIVAGTSVFGGDITANIEGLMRACGRS